MSNRRLSFVRTRVVAAQSGGIASGVGVVAPVVVPAASTG